MRIICLIWSNIFLYWCQSFKSGLQKLHRIPDYYYYCAIDGLSDMVQAVGSNLQRVSCYDEIVGSWCRFLWAWTPGYKHLHSAFTNIVQRISLLFGGDSVRPQLLSITISLMHILAKLIQCGWLPLARTIGDVAMETGPSRILTMRSVNNNCDPVNMVGTIFKLGSRELVTRNNNERAVHKGYYIVPAEY